jgi:hypothetical protein
MRGKVPEFEIDARRQLFTGARRPSRGASTKTSFTEEQEVFGPVPAKYRFIVWLSGLAAFAGLGVWVSPAVPFSAAEAATLGLTIGAVAVALFLHDFRHNARNSVARPR